MIRSHGFSTILELIIQHFLFYFFMKWHFFLLFNFWHSFLFQKMWFQWMLYEWKETIRSLHCDVISFCFSFVVVDTDLELKTSCVNIQVIRRRLRVILDHWINTHRKGHHQWSDRSEWFFYVSHFIQSVRRFCNLQIDRFYEWAEHV